MSGSCLFYPCIACLITAKRTVLNRQMVCYGTCTFKAKHFNLYHCCKRRWCSQVASHQCEVLQGCDYNVWIREHRDLHPALTILSSTTVLQTQFRQLCDRVRQHASTRLARELADVGCPPAPVTPPQCPLRTHSQMLKVRTTCKPASSSALFVSGGEVERWSSGVLITEGPASA